MAQTMIKVSVVVTVLNEAHTITALLESLDRQTLAPAEVLIVDAGSTDGTVETIEALEPKLDLAINVLTAPGNRSHGRNIGITQSTSKVIAITDAGCIPRADWLAELVTTYQAAKQQNNQSVVVGGYYDAHPTTDFESAVVPYVLVMPDKVDPNHFLPSTRSLMMDKSAWQKVGKFDERLEVSEDFAFSRLVAADPEISLVFNHKAIVSWRPRSTLSQFMSMIAAFAEWDVRAGIVRPKVLAIFSRYILAIAVISLLSTFSLSAGLFLTFLSACFYATWAITKNKRYAGSGWYWLPILQVTSDMMVMWGSFRGVLRLKIN